MRPETIAAGWSRGKPFYCGKTVQKPERRLQGHREKPYGDAGPRVVECGTHIRIHLVEVVAPDQDWAARERFGIYSMRLLWPGCCLNLSDGGEGCPGWVPDAEHRAWLSAKEQGKKRSPETRVKMSIAARNRSPEHLAKLGAANQGKKRSSETRAKISAAAKNPSPETRAKMSAARLGKKQSPEHIAKAAATRIGRICSPETRAKIGLANRTAARRRVARRP
jgi:hypothetical protein